MKNRKKTIGGGRGSAQHAPITCKLEKAHLRWFSVKSTGGMITTIGNNSLHIDRMLRQTRVEVLSTAH